MEKNQEIDLLEIASKFIEKVKRNKLNFLSIILIFVGLGSIFRAFQTEEFEAEVLTESIVEQNELIGKWITNLNQNKEKKASISPKIQNFTVVKSNSNIKDEDGILRLKIILNDTIDHQKTTNKVEEAINKIPSLQKALDKRKKQLNYNLEVFNEEIKKIETFQKMLLSDRPDGNVTINSNIMSAELVSIKTKSKAIEIELDQLTPIRFLSNAIYGSGSKYDYLKYYLLSLILGFIVASFYVLIKK